MRHFPHHIGDYAAATAHLSFVEDAAYHRLLRRYYQDEGPLPEDKASVCRLIGARTSQEKVAVETILREFFELRPDGWHNRRADREIEAYQNRADAARENGRRGGRPKPTKNPVGYPWDTKQEPPGKLTNNQEPITKNQEPLAKSAQAREPEPVSRSQLITEEWEPTQDDKASLAKEIPWLTGEIYDKRMRDFRDWCEGNATMSFSPAATWRGFMRKTKPLNGGMTESFDDRRIRLIREAIRS